MAEQGPIRHIVVLVDGTGSSYRAADLAVQLAPVHGAALTAMSLVEQETLRQLLHVKILVAGEMAEFEKELDRSMRRHLAEVRQRALRRQVAIKEVLLAGNTESVLPEYIAAHQVDLVVIGGFKGKDVTRDMVARQRQRILDHAACPVLVVK